MKKKKRVILPGSYDPVTLGHLDIIRRASLEFEEVFAVIFTNPEKSYTFSLEERVKMLILATDELENVIVSYSNGLVVDYMREHEIELIVKGIRNDADREYEKRQEEWNFAHGGYPTEYFLADEALAHVSSTAAREAIKRGEALETLLPEKVIEFIESNK